MTRASRDKWLDEGLAVLGASGVGAISSELLAVRLGVSKASFHWHFGDQAAFLRELVAHWSGRARDGDGPRLFTADPRVERAMRAWAIEDEDVAAAVRAVDQGRLRHLAQIHAGAPQPERMAQLEYAAFVGATWLFDGLDGDEARALEADLERVLKTWASARETSPPARL